MRALHSFLEIQELLLQLPLPLLQLAWQLLPLFLLRSVLVWLAPGVLPASIVRGGNGGGMLYQTQQD